MLHEPSAKPTAPQIVEPTSQATRPRVFFLVGALLAATIAAISIRGSAGIEPFELTIVGAPDSSGQGSLRVDGTTYRFTTDNCVITENEFIATGTGANTGDPFRIAASISSVELAFGANDELSEPAPGQLWLQSDQPPVWTADGQEVTADVDLRNPANPQSMALPATLQLVCLPSSG